jgi:hypothetical protein
MIEITAITARTSMRNPLVLPLPGRLPPCPPCSLRSGNLSPRLCRQRAPARAGRAACAAMLGGYSGECL